MTNESLVMMLKMATALYQNFEVNAETLSAWSMMLSEMPDITAEAAFKRHFNTSKFPPTVADIVGYANDLAKLNIEGATGAEAWEFVLGLAKHYGMYHVTKAREKWSQTPAIEWAMRQVGFHNICHSDINKALPFVRKAFIAAYDQYREKELAALQAEGKEIYQIYSGQKKITEGF